MKTDQAKQLTDNAIQQLAAALNEGRSETITRYLATMATFHHYSFTNTLLIFGQRPTATHVAGFHTWLKLGRYVRKGEKGIAIFAPMRLKLRADDERNVNQQVSDETTDQTVLRFRIVHVFDIEQTEGESLPEPARVEGEPAEHLTRLKALIAERGITLEYTDTLGLADGASIGGRIFVKAGKPAGEEFAVLVHELAHELLHRRPLEQRPSKTVRETEAEAVAFVVSHAIGLQTSTACSDYIQLYNGDAKTLMQSLERIQRTSAEILADLVPKAVAESRVQNTVAINGQEVLR